MKIIFNGNLLDDELVQISPLSNGFNYGEGFFTTIKVINGIPLLLDLHIKRIISSIYFFSFKISIPDLDLLIQRILNANNMSDARIKIIFFKDNHRISYLINCYELNSNVDPVELTIDKYIRGNEPIHRYKSLNYYSNLKSPMNIYLDHKNRVLETGFANIFIIQGKTIFTPSSKLPILPGVFRENLINVGEICGYVIKEKDIDVSDLHNCDAMFLTNSIRGIIPAKSFDNKYISTFVPKLLRDEIC